MESGVQLGLGEGPINEMGPLSQPCGPIDTASRTLAPSKAQGVFGPTLLWAAKGDLIPHIGGVVSHRAHKPQQVQSLFCKATDYGYLYSTTR